MFPERPVKKIIELFTLTPGWSEKLAPNKTNAVDRQILKVFSFHVIYNI